MKKTVLSAEEISVFCSALAHQLHAGISHGDALSLMAEDAGAPLSAVFSAMADAADGGLSLSRAAEETGSFPASLCRLLSVAETVGRTEETLFALSRYYEQQADFARRLRSAVLYPGILAAVMLAVTVIFLCWVLPVFDRVYGILGSRLTGFAAGLLLFGQALRRLLPAVGVLLFCGALLLSIPGVRKKLQGRTARNRSRAQLAQALALGLNGGLTDCEAFRLAADAAGGTPSFRARCTAAQEALDAGAALPAVLLEQAFLGRAECRLLEAAIRSGQRERAMETIAQRLQTQWDNALEARVSAIEPTLVLISSVLIGGILLAVMLPLAQLMSSLG